MTNDLQTAIDGVLDWKATAPASVAEDVEMNIAEARACLTEALRLWQPLHDPEPERADQNFQLNGQPYNYRAAETYSVLTDLQDGILTRNHARTSVALAHSVAPTASPRSVPKGTNLKTALVEFLEQLETYEESFQASEDEPIIHPLDIDHPLNQAATSLSQFYRAGKLPLEARRSFRSLIEESKTCADFTVIECCIDDLAKWASSELVEAKRQSVDHRDTKFSVPNSGTPHMAKRFHVAL